jgi:hypothetical protein
MRALQYGVTIRDSSRMQAGYVLFGPTGGRDCYLVGELGQIAHHWRLPAVLGNYGQLLENGNLLVSLRTPEGPKLNAAAGRIVELGCDGTIHFDYTDHFQHHDLQPTPDGNVIYLAWDLVPTVSAAKFRGGIRGSEHSDGGVYEDVLREVNRHGKVVWQWRVSDHLDLEKYPLREGHKRHEYAHANTCHVQADGNVLVSFRELDLLILVNRQTGKIDWEMADRSWGGQHDCQRLPNGNIILFANGSEQPTPEFSRMLEIDPASGDIVWKYQGIPFSTFYSARISGTQRLENGNTLIIEGHHGRIFEVTPTCEIVWEYISPFYNNNPELGPLNWIFRARKYARDDSRLANRTL